MALTFTDGCLTKQEADALTTAVATSAVGGGPLTCTTMVASSTAEFQGAVTCDTTLAVTGASTLTGAVGLTAGLTVGTTLAVTGASTLTGAVTMSAAATVGTTLGVTGATTLTGLTTLSSLGPVQTKTTAITATGAIAPHTPAWYVITKAGVAAMTLAAPTATTDDGVLILVTSSTTYAHTVTATGLLGTGTASVNVATFAAYAGAGLLLMAYQAKWLVLASVGVTFS